MVRKNYCFGYVIRLLSVGLACVGGALYRSLGVVRSVFQKLFKADVRIMWARALPVLFVNPAVYLVKFDKVREYFSFLRVKQSWLAS